VTKKDERGNSNPSGEPTDMIMTVLDHSIIDLENLDPTTNCLLSKEARLFLLEDLENLEGQVAQDMGETKIFYYSVFNI
jgi:hypothetical protein